MKALKLRDVNLYERYIANPEKKKQAARRVKLAIPIVAEIIVLVAAAVLLNLKRIGLENEIAAKQEIIDKSEQSGVAEESGRYSGSQSLYSGMYSQLELYKRTVASYPQMRAEIVDDIFTKAGKDIALSDFAYDMSSGTAMFNAVSMDVNRIPAYVSELRNSGYFSDVVYAGYVGDSDSGKLNLSYSFVIGCRLNETMDTSEFDEFVSVTDELAVDEGEGVEPIDFNADKAEAAEAAAK